MVRLQLQERECSYGSQELLLDHADRARVGAHEVELRELGERAVEGLLRSLVEDHDEAGLLADAALDHALDRDAGLAEDVGDRGEDAGAVRDLQVDVEGGRDVGDDRRARACVSWTGASPARIETTSPSTAVAVATPPAPGPDIVISVIAGAWTMTALNGPSTGASGWPG